ncbi:MAG: DUF721 domain-containing protein [Bradymonadaceae bacterium]|nr:DUF721 domain-containing protein [Lujinxingiaceae bacterium]
MLKSLLKDILDHSATVSARAAPTPAMLQQVWPTLVGEELARCTHPVGWRAGVLDLEVKTASLLVEFERQRPVLRARIAALLPWPLTDITLALAPRTRKFHVALAVVSDERGVDLSPSIRAQELSAALLTDLERLDEDTRACLLRIGQRVRTLASRPPDDRGA